jgi:hypothetical protein
MPETVAIDGVVNGDGPGDGGFEPAAAGAEAG